MWVCAKFLDVFVQDAYTYERRQRRADRNHSLAVRRVRFQLQVLRRRWWRQWRTHCSQRLLDRAMYSLAVKHWGYTLLQRAWYV